MILYKLKKLGIVFLLFLLPNVIYAFLALFLSFNRNIQFDFADTISLTALFWIPFIYLYFKKSHLTFDFFKSIPQWKLSILSILMGIIYASGSLLCNYLFWGRFPQVPNLSILFILGSFLAAPFVEELFFRRWISCYMEKHGFSYIYIMIISSFLFYFIHWLPMTERFWYYRIDTFIMGLLQFCLYKKTKDIRYCIIAHISTSVFVNCF